MEFDQSKKQGNQLLCVGIVGFGWFGVCYVQVLVYGMCYCMLVVVCSLVVVEWVYVVEYCGVLQLYENFDDMLVNLDIDVVVLVMFILLYVSQMIVVLCVGKYVFVEKLLVLNVEDCEVVLKVVEQYLQQVVMVGFVCCFDLYYQVVQWVIVQGEIGWFFIVNLQICDLNDLEGFFVCFVLIFGGIFMDCSIYDIDFVCWMLGKLCVLCVFVLGINVLYFVLVEYGDVDNGLVMIEFEGGVCVVFYVLCMMVYGYEISIEIIGIVGKLQIGEYGVKDCILCSDGYGVCYVVLCDFYECFEVVFQVEMVVFVVVCWGEKVLELELVDVVEVICIGLVIMQVYWMGQVVEVC